jgi:FkbM family methyltransferase
MRNPILSLSKRVWKTQHAVRVATRRNARFLLDPQKFIDHRLLSGLPFENEAIAFAREMIEQHALRRMIDVGANFGLYTILLGRLDAIETAIAFEPVRRNYAQLMANLFLNRLTAKVDVHRVGVSNRGGTAEIAIFPNSPGDSSLHPERVTKKLANFTEQETISLVRVDDVLHWSDMRIFIKVDVEGHAPEAVEGMRTLLTANTAVLQIELHVSERPSTIAFLKTLGYEPIRHLGVDIIFANGEILDAMRTELTN